MNKLNNIINDVDEISSVEASLLFMLYSIKFHIIVLKELMKNERKTQV